MLCVFLGASVIHEDLYVHSRRVCCNYHSTALTVILINRQAKIRKEELIFERPRGTNRRIAVFANESDSYDIIL